MKSLSNVGHVSNDALGRVRNRALAALVVTILLISAMPMSALGSEHSAGSASLAGSGDCDYFEVTDSYLCFGFRSYWNDFGGLEIFGYPITNEFQENGVTVQYFERARLEWHPGVWPERHDVLQGRLGVEMTRDMAGEGAFAPTDAVDGCLYFDATGHNVCGAFADRWQDSGGLAVFGYPISEAYEFDGVTVQFFERSRMEHRPGAWPERHDVLLGRVGNVQASHYQIQEVTEKYHDVDVALADGYEPIEINGELCVTHHDLGTMGIHYLKADLVGEEPIDILQPQLLLYIPTEDGLRLTAVEYFTPDVGQPHPILFDRYMDGPIDTIEGVPVHFQLHVWVWDENPAGVYARYNPALNCP